MPKIANCRKGTTLVVTSLSLFFAAKIGVRCSVRTRRTTTRSSKSIAVANLRTMRIRRPGLTRLAHVELTADLALLESSGRNMGAIVDLIQAQGMAAGQIYGYVPDPPWGPPHQCPGCQPRPDKPVLAAKWDEWHVCEKKLLALGESSSCPIVRGERLPEPYTNEERIARSGMPTDRLPKCAAVEPAIVGESAHVDATPLDESTSTQAAEDKPAQDEPTRKTPAKRAPKPKEAPKGQGSLW